MNFSTIFSFLEPLEPYTKMATSAYGMLVNYRQNKKIESVENDISKIKDILGLKEVQLSENELKIISMFIEKSEKKDYATYNIILDYDEFKKLDIDEDIDDLLILLESYGFLDVQKFISGNPNYRLNYLAFINSNLIENIFSESITYSELFKLVVNHLYENHRKESILNTKQLIDELSLNDFLINPILYHLDNIGVIELSKTLGNVDLIASSSFLRSVNLVKLHRELNQ